MAINFNEMAAKAKAIHSGQRAKEEQIRAAELEERARIVDASVKLLKEHILPLLREANAAFNKEGIDSTIEEKFDVKNRASIVMPSIVFRFVGPPREEDGWSFDALPVFFSADESHIYFHSGKESFDIEPKELLGKATPESIEPLVTKAIEIAISSYYEVLRDRHTQLMS